jgi:ribosomal-protein-alanine N-acetyltransferase
LIATERLILRPWRPSDLEPLAALNADPIVMRFLGGALGREESDAYADRAMAHLAEHGFGRWAVELTGVAPFIGTVGLSYIRFQASFTPAVEIAWRLDRAYWGRGYATEAAQAAIDDGFRRGRLKSIVAMTVPGNRASIRVMEHLGMMRSIEFDHPNYRPEHPLCRHVLYRLDTTASY